MRGTSGLDPRPMASPPELVVRPLDLMTWSHSERRTYPPGERTAIPPVVVTVRQGRSSRFDRAARHGPTGPLVKVSPSRRQSLPGSPWPRSRTEPSCRCRCIGMAAVGTTTAPESSSVTIDTVALDPPYKPGGLPVTFSTTGKGEAPEVVPARSPTDATVPAMREVRAASATEIWAEVPASGSRPGGVVRRGLCRRCAVGPVGGQLGRGPSTGRRPRSVCASSPRWRMPELTESPLRSRGTVTLT